ncbi:MAG TPA: VLRF1 family aeRF1-type release factor [Solirubrobacterales bacterium]|nr:VLRF1 family aeRF1-type release factor [Solirubrobacterales bacterium]
MAHPTLADARELSDWRPPMGVISIYLGFDPADRSAAWRIELRNGINRALELAEDGEHERKVAMRETAKRLLHRFNDEEVRPPPRGEAGFVEVSRGEGKERWWGTGVAPVLPAVAHADQPLVTELVDLCQRGEGCGVALLSAERVRLLGCAEGTLEEIEEWELTILSRAWRERKAESSPDPARIQGVSSSGHDQYAERLEHNRHRFLVECGRLAGERLRERGFGDVLAFGPRPDAEAFWKGLGSTQLRRELGGEQDLISMPRGELIDEVAAAIARSRTRRDRAFVERALEEALGGSRGGSGVQETLAALKERRVEHLAFDPAIGDPAEALVRGALAGDAEITIARDGVAELLAPAEGVAAILRY